MPLKDPEQRRLIQREWKRRNRTKINARRRKAYADDADRQRERAKQYRRANPEKVNAYNAEWSRRYRARLRQEMFDAYGDRCVCCGETEPLFLQLDHIDGGGTADRKRHKTGAKMLAWLKRNDWPSGFQILCANCNIGKHLGGGVCPHMSDPS